MGIPIIKIRRSHDGLIFIMEIPKPEEMFFILKSFPESSPGGEWVIGA